MDSFSTSLVIVPKGSVKRLHKTFTKSFSASANNTLLVSLFTTSFNDTCTSSWVVAIQEQANGKEGKFAQEVGTLY